MTDFLGRWANQSEENAKLVAQELLIAEATEKLWADMEDSLNADLVDETPE